MRATYQYSAVGFERGLAWLYEEPRSINSCYTSVRSTIRSSPVRWRKEEACPCHYGSGYWQSGKAG
ncbi:hypothetical protein IF2G_09978 [Cordyceps javanica]|nr:hypothetical protein IF2G_09978 [Cordyceps javanica]